MARPIKIAGTGADDATVGSITWSNTSNITLADDTYATAAVTEDATSHYLKATNFGFAIPTWETINGIIVEIEQKSSGSGLTENSIKIVKGGTISGNEKSTSATISTTEKYVTYGGVADLWGLTWTPADINDSTFGVVFASHKTGPGTVTTSVDTVRITIVTASSIPSSMSKYIQVGNGMSRSDSAT